MYVHQHISLLSHSVPSSPHSPLQDYVHFSLARHCFSLQRLRDARLAFEHLLGHESVQSAAQQLLNLREYIYVHKVCSCVSVGIKMCAFKISESGYLVEVANSY